MSPTACCAIRSFGCVSVHGAGSAPLLEALTARTPCPRRPPPTGIAPEPDAALAAGWIDPVPRPDRWLGKPVRFGRLDRLSQLALIAAHQTLAAGGAPPSPERAGLVFGTACGAHLSNELFWRGLQQPDGASPGLFAYTLPSSAAGEISIHLGIRGPCVTLAHDTTSGLAALTVAAQLLAAGSADWVLAGGADVLGVTLLRSRGAASAEGAAFFVLAREADAPLARLVGAAQSAGRGSRAQAVAAALEQAGLRADELRTTIDDEWSDGVRVVGECLAARPLLGLCAALARPALLPALVVAAGPEGSSAVCLGPGRALASP
jgi:hypothetical protein